MPDDCDKIGQHFADPAHDGKCFCQTFLYHDLPPSVRAKDPFKMIMEASDVHVGDRMPSIGKKVEVLFTTPDPRWWICSVLDVDHLSDRVRVKMDGRSDLQPE